MATAVAATIFRAGRPIRRTSRKRSPGQRTAARASRGDDEGDADRGAGGASADLGFSLFRRANGFNDLGAPGDWGDEASGTGREEAELAERRRRRFLRYVAEVEPEISESFDARAPPEVVDAMRQTVGNLLGTLPPQFFSVSISGVAENLAQLMYSMLMTGYMFRNAQYRMELQNSVALPGSSVDVGDGGSLGEEIRSVPARCGDYSPGSQKIGVEGEVIKYSESSGVERRGASEYIGDLEDEVEALRAEIERLRRAAGGMREDASSDTDKNILLDYIKRMEPENLRDLTTDTGPEVLEAMNAFIKRILGTDDTSELASTTAEVTNVELSKMVYWLMVVGYSLRTMEVKFEMESKLKFPANASWPAGELPPGTTN